jgi:protein arginine kinase
VKPEFDEWLSGQGPQEEVVICTRVRLARNLEGFRFAAAQDSEEAEVLTQTAEKALRPIARKFGWEWVDLAAANSIDRQVLVERHLISRELGDTDRARGVMFDDVGRASLMVNEEDHLRLQVFRSGLRLRDAWEAADGVDDEMASILPFAYSSAYGYLTSCPTNTGTGLRISVLLHLPALVASKQIETATNAIQEMNMTVRGLYGEGSQALGDLFQISNQRTLGDSEQHILESVESAVTSLLAFEHRHRDELRQKPLVVQDRAYRALGVLERARTLTSEETMTLLSRLRLGRVLHVLDAPPIEALNRIFLLTQPAHLQKRVGHPLDPHERDQHRAELVRKILAG